MVNLDRANAARVALAEAVGALVAFAESHIAAAADHADVVAERDAVVSALDQISQDLENTVSTIHSWLAAVSPQPVEPPVDVPVEPPVA